MFNVIILILLISILFTLLLVCKDLIIPPIILTISWIIPVLWLVMTEGIGVNSYQLNIYAFIFPLGIFVFILGFFFVNKKIPKHPKAIEVVDNRRCSLLFKIFIVFELMMSIYFFYDVYKYILGHFQYNIWFTYKWSVSMGEYIDFFLIPYLRTASRIITCIMFIQFLKKDKYKLDNKWFYLQFIVAFALNMFGQGRGGMFSFIIPMAIIYMLMHRKSNIQLIRIAIKFIVVLSAIFTVYAILKTPYDTSTKTSMMVTLENYLCGSLVAFCNWAASKHVIYNGVYTFRFFLAVLNAIGINVPVVSMVEPYVTNMDGSLGNVYTIYKWYANDFGLAYAVSIQFILGLLYGWIYKKTFIKKTQMWLIIYSVSFYPLFMQFFNDQYITMLSVWIQTGFWIWIFLKTFIFYVNCTVKDREKVKKVKRLRLKV